jgi:hypothetical protein
MNNLIQIEKRIEEKQKIFNKISLKRQQRIKTVEQKILTKDSYVQTDEYTKKIINLEIENNNEEEIIEVSKTFCDKGIQCLIDVKKVEIKDTIYLKRLFEKIADIEISDFFSFDENNKLLQLNCLYQINPVFLNYNSNFSKNLNLVFFDDFEMVLKVVIIKKKSMGKELFLFNKKHKIIAKFPINLKINDPFNISIINSRFFFNGRFIFEFDNLKYFYSSSNNFII